MKIYHPDCMNLLPPRLLCWLHRDLCRIRGTAWGRGTKMAWLWRVPINSLVWYHSEVMREMVKRGYNPAGRWNYPEYRGRKSAPLDERYFRQDNLPPAYYGKVFLESFPGSVWDSVQSILAWEKAHKKV